MINYYQFSSFLGGITSLSISIFVYIKNKKNIINITWGLLSLCAAIWSFGYFCMISTSNSEMSYFWRFFTESGATLIPAFWLHFVYSLLNLNKEKKKWIIVCYLFSFFLWCLNFTPLFAKEMVKKYIFNFYPTAGIGYYLFFLYFWAVALYSFYELLKIYKKSSGFRKNQIQYIMMVSFFGFGGGGMTFLLTFNIPIPPYGIILFALYPIVIAYAILKYQLMDIETVIHKTLAWIFASSFALVPIVILAYKLKPWYTQAPAFQVALLCGGVFYLLTLYMRYTQPKIDHFFQRRRYDLEEIASRFTDDLVHLKGINKLIQRIEDTIADTLYPQEIDIFLHNDSQKKYKLVNIMDREREVVELEGNNEFLLWLVKHNLIAYRQFAQIDPAYAPIKEKAEEYFDLTDADMVVPLVLNEKLIGVINLGKKSNLKRYNAVDLHFLRTLKNQSAIAISNSLLYENMEEQVRQRTKELIEVQKQLVQAEKLATMGTLAGGVAHEINNPLAAILTNAQMLLSGSTINDKMDRESLELIEEATKRCRTIVKKLMTYARKPLETTQISQVNLSDVLKNIVAFLSYQLRQDNIELVIKTEEDNYLVMGNQNELEQVLTNLILNAKDAIKKVKNSGNIYINLSDTLEWIRMEVRDEGGGIPEEVLSKIFDPFFTTKDVGKGTGLGLSICQAIVEKHKGIINVQSESDKGSVFTVQLPKVKQGQQIRKEA